MSIPVILSIQGRQTYAGQAPETIRLDTEGTMEYRNGGWDITYEESELTGLVGVTTTFRVEPGKVTLIHGLLSEGFELTDDTLAVITAGDVLGKQKVRRVRSGPKGKQIRYFSDLNPGDYVVQATHGIGKYLGIRTIELSGIHRDYITIQYAGNDKLYLPVEKISSLEKYIGPEGETPKLHDMGSSAWTKARAKAKKSIEELAEKLLAVYAKREITQGIAFAPDTAEQREFEDTFPYVETTDQLLAIDAIKKAMEKPMPWAPPVIRATLPCRLKAERSMIFSLSQLNF